MKEIENFQTYPEAEASLKTIFHILWNVLIYVLLIVTLNLF